MKYKHILRFCLTFMGITMTGLMAVAQVEELMIIHDRDLYLEGDTIWLKIVSTDSGSGRMAQLSSTAYIELLGQGEQLIQRTKIGLSEAVGYGWIGIPEGLFSGYYYLRAYTSWMKNSPPEGYAYALIRVVNPYHPLYHGQADRDSSATGFRISGEGEASGLHIEIGLESNLYKRNQKIRIPIEVSDRDNNMLESHLSVSVYLAGMADIISDETRSHPGPADIFSVMGSDAFSVNDSASRDGEWPFYPELAGAAVSGVIVDRITGLPVGNTTICCTSVGSASQFRVFRTGEDGRFRFVPVADQGGDDLVFSILGSDRDLDIRVDDPYSQAFLQISMPALDLDTSQLDYIEQLSLNRQVTAAYSESRETTREEAAADQYCFYGNPSETVILDRFIQLPVMEEFFRELVKSVVVYRQEGSLKLGVIDASTRGIIGDRPLFLLDGIPLFDHSAILELNPEDIRQIHVVASKYFVGNLEFDGIIDLRSAEGQYETFEFPRNSMIYRFQPLSSPRIPVRGEGISPLDDEGENHLPDFRSLTCWNPRLITDDNGEAELTFVAPDVPGIYRVVVRGITPGGKAGSGITEIRVD